MYWTLRTGQSVFPANAGLIQRANLDGSGAETLTTSAGAKLGGLRVDTIAGRVYWTTYLPGSAGSGAIRRVGLDGQSLEDVITGLSEPRDVALDLGGGKVYWTDSGTGKIQRANLTDGANVEDLITGIRIPFGLDLDIASGKVYWTDASGMIQRANIDGSNAETLVSGRSEPTGIVVVTQTPTSVYSQSRANRFTVQTLPNVDSPGSTFVVCVPRDGPVSVSIYDVAGQRVAELDGGNRAAGVFRLTWSALDTCGHAVPRGVYFFQARFDNELREGKVLIVR